MIVYLERQSGWRVGGVPIGHRRFAVGRPVCPETKVEDRLAVRIRRARGQNPARADNAQENLGLRQMMVQPGAGKLPIAPYFRDVDANDVGRLLVGVSAKEAQLHDAGGFRFEILQLVQRIVWRLEILTPPRLPACLAPA